MAGLGNRIVVLIDMDCFFCQVETRLNPKFQGKPLAVVQYNPWRQGGIIAVNYEARDFGVTRHMRGEEAKEKCPEIILASVPCVRGKADTSRYRSAGREVIDVLKKNYNIVERASVDEAYLDITQIVDEKFSKEMFNPEDISMKLNNSYIVEYSDSGVNDEEDRKKGVEAWLSESSEDTQIQRLAIAGAFVENLRKEIYETTHFRCSAGISFNKILAKLACGLHKPNRQTILPASAVLKLFETLPVKKVKNLGGKLGDIVIDSLKCNVMADLLRFPMQYLQNRFDEKTGHWLYNIARGIDSEPVTPRLVSKSIGACKRFPGKQAIVDVETLKHWLGELSAEVCERLEQDLEENKRKASLLTVSFQYYQNKTSVSQSRSCVITSYKQEKVTEQCFNIVMRGTQQLPVSFLGLSAGKFVKAKGSENFMNFFKSNTNDQSNFSINNSVHNKTNNTAGKSKEEDITGFENNINNIEMHEERNENCLVQKSDDKNVKPPCSTTINRRSSPCSSLQKSLKSDNFKKSFFMNILKDNQTKNNDVEENKNTEQNSSKLINLKNNQDCIENNIEVKHLYPHNLESQFKNGSENNEASVRLQEIFPDLNDIDPNIVRMLPFHLQDEAKRYLKTVESCNRNSIPNKVKNKEINKTSKGKSKLSNQKPSIKNFFIKTDVNNDFSNNLRKCSQCDQLILVDKFDEHSDYHVAQNLQKEINQMSSSEEQRKRKIVLNSPNRVKKRISDENINSMPTTKSVTSYFQ